MKKGGYQIIDMAGVDAITTAQTVAGIYEAIEGNYNKPVILTGIVVQGVEYDDAAVQFRSVGQTFVASAYGYTFMINAQDKIQVSELKVTKATGDAITVAQFNNLLTVLESSGIIKTN